MPCQPQERSQNAVDGRILAVTIHEGELLGHVVDEGDPVRLQPGKGHQSVMRRAAQGRHTARFQIRGFCTSLVISRWLQRN